MTPAIRDRTQKHRALVEAATKRLHAMQVGEVIEAGGREIRRHSLTRWTNGGPLLPASSMAGFIAIAERTGA